MDLEVFLSQSVTDINLWYMDLCWGIKHSTLAQTALKLFISLFVYNIIVCNQSIWDFNWIDVFQTHPHLSMEIKQRKVNTVARHNKCHWPWHLYSIALPPPFKPPLVDSLFLLVFFVFLLHLLLSRCLSLWTPQMLLMNIIFLSLY